MPNYSVRLVLRVAAESPDKAPPTFITHLVEDGMTDWVYQVCDPDDDMKVIGYFDGYGIPVNVDKLGTPETPSKLTPEQTPVQTEGEDDTELLSLAQELNDQDEPADPTEPQPQE